MAKYYNYRYTSVPVFHPSDKFFLDSSDIYMICSLIKLSYHHLRFYIVEKQICFISYYLKVKLTTVFDNLILRKHSGLPLDPVIINKKKKVESKKDSG